MGYIEGHSRDQMLLLPASVDDYVAADNPVRFIAAFVDDLDLGELGFGRSRPNATGRPGYDPADLLKLYLYGYLNRVRSSRCLAAETARNLEVIWLLGGLRPDFRTIADFRRANRAAFKPLFQSFVLLCRRLDLFGRELVAVDGTRLKAVNSRKRNFTRQKLAGWIKLADERIEEYLARLDLADRAEAEAEGAARRAAALEAKIARMRERRELHSAMLADLIASGESQLSLTDPDARGMATHPKVGVGYNAQVAVDDRHKLIVEQYVTNSGSDLGFLAQTASAAREVLGIEQIEPSPTRAITRVRTLPPVRMSASFPMSCARNAARISTKAISRRASFGTMPTRIATPVPADSASILIAARRRTDISPSVTAMRGQPGRVVGFRAGGQPRRPHGRDPRRPSGSDPQSSDPLARGYRRRREDNVRHGDRRRAARAADRQRGRPGLLGGAANH
jgi:transposase